jgi:hypothetical protein
MPRAVANGTMESMPDRTFRRQMLLSERCTSNGVVINLEIPSTEHINALMMPKLRNEPHLIFRLRA